MDIIKDKPLFRRSALAGIVLIVVAAVTLEATAIVQYIFARQGIREEASKRAESRLETTRAQILDVANQAEAAVRNSMWIAAWCLEYPDSLPVVTRRIVEDNPVVVGSTIALVPGYIPEQRLLAPYSCYDPENGNIVLKSLATEEYDYPSQDWFTKPIETGGGYWSEPYIDTGGGDIMMTTYSMPVRDSHGRIAAVITADISLDWLSEMLSDVQVYPNAYSVVLSRSGQIMVCPAETLVMKMNIGDVASSFEGNESFDSLSHSMLSGRSGNIPLRYNGKTSYVYFAPVEKTGWSMSIVIPDNEIYGGIRRVGLAVKLLQLLGLLMLILLLRAVAKNQIKYLKMSENKERMERELQIGRGIQMSMIPKIFPPFPERKDLDMAASIVPAKEVGGDLYDFYIRDEKLFFCIGDVSGKGVPASLVMAVTRSLFRTVSAHQDSPRRIVSDMNDSMSDMNDSNMFVTFFCGVLNLADGQLLYCNAGHNAPVMLTDRKVKLDVEPNLPLGVMPGMEYREQEIRINSDDAIFLYTDGLTEAENLQYEQFGEERLLAVLHERRGAMDQLKAIQKAVESFVGQAPQSDDLTMLLIHFLGKGRHLTLKNDVGDIPRLADFVQALGEENQLDAGLTMSLNLALEEAVTNVMLYAYPEGTEGSVEVDAWVQKGRLLFTITDRGVAFDPTMAPEADTSLSLEERPIGGLGILMVRNIMDGVSYERRDGKNRLTMIKNV